jgi:anti-sigma regulatory factor (Ser/Thr protein kinase)
MELKLNNNLAEVQRLRLAVEDYCRALDVSDKTIHRITLAMEELITNTISYGYADATPHVIDITITRQANRLAIDVIDDAAAFDPRDRHRETLAGGLENRPVGGLGLHLLSYLSDDLNYRFLNPGNHTTLGFYV